MSAKIKRSNKCVIKGILVVEDGIIKMDIGEDGEENLVDVAAQIDFLNGAEVTLSVGSDVEIA